MFVIIPLDPYTGVSSASCPSHEASWGQVPTGDPSARGWLAIRRQDRTQNATELAATSGLEAGLLQAADLKHGKLLFRNTC